MPEKNPRDNKTGPTINEPKLAPIRPITSATFGDDEGLKAEGCFGGARGSYSNPNIWVFPKIGVFPPKWMVKIMENLIKMDDLGKTHYFRKHPYGGIIILLKFGKLQYLFHDRCMISFVYLSELNEIHPQIEKGESLKSSYEDHNTLDILSQGDCKNMTRNMLTNSTCWVWGGIYTQASPPCTLWGRLPINLLQEFSHQK